MINCCLLRHTQHFISAEYQLQNYSSYFYDIREQKTHQTLEMELLSRVIFDPVITFHSHFLFIFNFYY